MEAVRSWFNKLKPKDKLKSSNKKETMGSGKEGPKTQTSEETPSTVTKQKVAAAKQYIEDHYKKQMKNLQERKERYDYYIHFSSCLLKISSGYIMIFLCSTCIHYH